MGRWVPVMLLIVIGLIATSGARETKFKYGDDPSVYNHTLACILVQYASAVYITDLTALFTWTCSRCNDLTKGFEVMDLIIDVKNCLQAFVGVAHDLNSIIVAFRGTQEHSIRNWIEDLYWKQLDLNYPGVEDAMVHHGFYSAYHNTTLRHGVLSAVGRAKKSYGNLSVIVTGHSMGGALASFCALDLSANYGAQDVQLMTFGQPRLGNSVFASYFEKQVPHTIRVTHQNDIVPHLPPYYPLFPRKTYHHFRREVWLKEIKVGKAEICVERICDRSGEDPSCSMSVYGDSISDHLEYYGITLRADSSNACEVIMDNWSLQNHESYGGNIILSRDQSAPLSVIASINSF